MAPASDVRLSGMTSRLADVERDKFERMSNGDTGRIVVTENNQTFRAEWRANGSQVEITSEIGSTSVNMGALRSAPATVAREQFRGMVREATRVKKPVGDRARFDFRGV